MITSVKWITFAQVFKLACQLISIIVLARLIAKEDYGVVAIALAIVNFAAILKDSISSTSIIQRRNLSEATIASAHWLNVVVGFFIFFCAIIFAKFAANFFQDPQIASTLVILSSIYPIQSLSSIHQALLDRKSKFQSIAIIEISATAIGLGAAIICALNGFGIFSLLIQSLLFTSLSTLLFRIVGKHQIQKEANLKEAVQLVKWGWGLSAFNLVTYVARNSDVWLIGKFLGIGAVGSYSMAYRIMTIPLQTVTFVANRASLPVFSQISERKDFQSLYIKSISNISYIAGWFSAALYIGAIPAVELILGSKWSESALLLEYLAWVAFIQAIVSTSGTVLISQGKLSLLFKLGITGATLHVGAFYIGTHYGVLTVAKLYLLSNIINSFFPIYWVCNSLSLSKLQYLAAITPATIAFILSALISKQIFSTTLDISNQSAIGIAAVLSMAIFLFPVLLTVFIRIAKKLPN